MRENAERDREHIREDKTDTAEQRKRARRRGAAREERQMRVNGQRSQESRGHRVSERRAGEVEGEEGGM